MISVTEWRFNQMIMAYLERRLNESNMAWEIARDKNNLALNNLLGFTYNWFGVLLMVAKIKTAFTNVTQGESERLIA